MEENNKWYKSISENRYNSSGDIARKTLSKILKRKRTNIRNISVYIISILLSIMIMCNSMNSESVIERISLMIENSNGFAGFIVAGTISGYMLFSAILTKDTIKLLVSVEDEEKNENGENKTLFEVINNYFVEILAILTMYIGFNFLLDVTIDLIDKFNLSISDKFLFGLVYSIYISISLNILVEFMCFIYNVYNLILVDVISKMKED